MNAVEHDAVQALAPRDCILRLPVVCARTGLSAATVYRRIAAGHFPRAVSLGGKAVGWRESAINAWIAARGGDA